MEPHLMKQQSEVAEEIVALHDFIAAWFRGEPDQDRGLFDQGFSNRLADGFFNIQPAGTWLQKSGLTDPIYQGHGSNPSFQIEIHHVKIHRTFNGDRLILASYIEVQHGSKNTRPPTNARRSTVLFERCKDEGALIWQHVHETAVDMSAVKGSDGG